MVFVKDDKFYRLYFLKSHYEAALLNASLNGCEIESGRHDTMYS